MNSTPATYGSETPAPGSRRRIRVRHLIEAKEKGRKLTMLTAYDALFANIFDEAGVDMLLVGDSVGNVYYNYPTTLPVSLEQMQWHTRAVAAGAKASLVVADLPFGSYESSAELAVESAVTLMKCGAHAVKLEGGQARVKQVRALTEAGIPVVAHLGYTPQSDNLLSGPRVQGRGATAQVMLADALALQEAGAVCLVLEMVPASLAQRISTELRIPTIGIGSGPDCDGQVLVWSDMTGMTEWAPRFVHRFSNGRQLFLEACRDYIEAVEAAKFPTPDNYHQE